MHQLIFFIEATSYWLGEVKYCKRATNVSNKWQFRRQAKSTSLALIPRAGVQLECAEKLDIVRMERDRFLIVSSVEQASANINHD